MVDVGRAVAWESGHLVFADEPLSSVVERINRYATRPVKVDRDIGKLRISGVFRTGDLDTFVDTVTRSEEHTSELQSLMRISYAVFCLKKKKLRKSIETGHKSTNKTYH